MNKSQKEAIKELYRPFDELAPGESRTYFGTRLHMACEINDVAEVKRLLADPAYDPNAFAVFDTCLHKAAWSGALGAVKLLLKDERVSANTLNLSGETALIRAAEGQHIDLVEYLVKRTDASQVSNHGQNALMIAALVGNGPIVELLTKHIDPMATNEEGETALMFAAKSGDAQCLKLLLPLSDIQAVDERGENALMKAALWGNRKAVIQLMRHISVDEVNKDGLDAIGVAKRSLEFGWSENGKGIQSVIDFLEAYKLSLKGLQKIQAPLTDNEKNTSRKSRSAKP